MGKSTYVTISFLLLIITYSSAQIGQLKIKEPIDTSLNGMRKVYYENGELKKVALSTFLFAILFGLGNI